MKVFKCESCDQECDVIEVDEGGYEEIWGAKTWHSMKVSASNCCLENFEEVEQEELADL